MQPSITSGVVANDSASRQTDAHTDAAVSQVFNGLLAGPIIPTLLKLAAPTVVVLVVQTFVSVIETYFVGFLGKDALAGVALVFPVLMLMTMMSNGALGGGAASASRGRSAAAGGGTPMRLSSMPWCWRRSSASLS
jgi:MatE